MSRILVREPIAEAVIRLLRERGFDVDVDGDSDLAETIGAYDAIVVRSATKVTAELIGRAQQAHPAAETMLVTVLTEPSFEAMAVRQMPAGRERRECSERPRRVGDAPHGNGRCHGKEASAHAFPVEYVASDHHEARYDDERLRQRPPDQIGVLRRPPIRWRQTAPAKAGQVERDHEPVTIPIGVHRHHGGTCPRSP